MWQMIISWLKENSAIIKNIVITIIGIFTGLFAVKKLTNKINMIKDNNKNTNIGDSSIDNNIDSNIINHSTDNKITQIKGNNYEGTVIINNYNDAMNFTKAIIPTTDFIFKALGINLESFLLYLELEFSKIAPINLKKLSQPNIALALRNALKNAAFKDSKEIHQILAKLIADILQKPKSSLAELTLNKAISLIEDVDAPLLSILAFSFLFLRTRFPLLLGEEKLFEKLTFISSTFNNLEVSQSQFEYLESISCGKLLPFHNNLLKILLDSYPQLFHKKITSQQLTDLALPNNIQNICFIPVDSNSFKLDPYAGLYLFENASIATGNVPFLIADLELKNRLIAFLNTNRLTPEEVKELLSNSIPKFVSIIDIWNEKMFANFSLTSVGIAIAISYLELKNLGNFDINEWIK